MHNYKATVAPLEHKSNLLSQLNSSNLIWGITGCTQPPSNTKTFKATLGADFQYVSLFLTNLNNMKSPPSWDDATSTPQQISKALQGQPIRLIISMQPYEEEQH